MTNLPTLKKTNELAKLNNSLSIINKLLPAKDISNKEWWNSLPEIWKKILMLSYLIINNKYKVKPYTNGIEASDIERYEIIPVDNDLLTNIMNIDTIDCWLWGYGEKMEPYFPDLRRMKNLKRLSLVGFNLAQANFNKLLPENILSLRLWMCNISDYKKLKITESMEYVDLSMNKFTEIDIDLFLHTKELSLTDCGLENIIFHKNNMGTALTEKFFIGDNHIKDFSFLNNFNRINELDISFSELNNLNLKKFKNLKNITLYFCGVSNIDFLLDLNTPNNIHLNNYSTESYRDSFCRNEILFNDYKENHITEHHIIKLKDKFPNCNIYSD